MLRRELAAWLLGLTAIACRREESQRAIDPSVAITPLEIGSARLERADGSTVDLESWIGRPFVLHFWASWCAPCRRELPELLRADSARRVLAVSLDTDWRSVRSFFGRGDVPQQVARERDRTLARTLGVGALPDTYLIDAQGCAHRRIRGARDWRRPELAAWLRGRFDE